MAPLAPATTWGLAELVPGRDIDRDLDAAQRATKNLKAETKDAADAIEDAFRRSYKKAKNEADDSNATEVQMRSIREARPAPLERPLGSRDVARAAVNIVNLLNEDELRHHDQPELNAAVDVAVKRAFSTGTGWAFGKPKGREEADITGLEAAALAVYVLDQETDGTPAIKDAIFFGA